MYKLAPSILAADLSCLNEEVSQVYKAGAHELHIDVMDGMFVPSISFGIPVMKALRQKTEMFFDVHLMIEEPIRYIGDFADAGADGITVHAEACRHLSRTLQTIKKTGRRTGVSLNPATPLEVLSYILDDLDMVLLMSVNPGFGGQQFIPAIYDKIRSLRGMLDEKGYQNIEIQVDGGVTAENAARIIAAGANILVAGTAVFKGNKNANVAMFKEVFKNAAGKS